MLRPYNPFFGLNSTGSYLPLWMPSNFQYVRLQLLGRPFSNPDCPKCPFLSQKCSVWSEMRHMLYHMVLYDIALCFIALHGIYFVTLWYCMVLHCMIWYLMLSILHAFAFFASLRGLCLARRLLSILAGYHI